MATSYIDLMPGDDTSPAMRRSAERRELENLRTERSALLGRIDALQGEIDSLRRNQQVEYERGLRDGARTRALPSILGGMR